MISKKRAILTFVLLSFCAVALWDSGRDNNGFSKFKHQRELSDTVKAEDRAPAQDGSLERPEESPDEISHAQASPPQFKTRNAINEKRIKAQKFLALKKSRRGNDQTESSRPADGDFFNERGEGFFLEDELVAVKGTEYNAGEYPNAPMVNGYFLVDKEIAPQDALAVVVNGESGSYAVFTGILKVKLSEFGYRDILARNYGGAIEQSYDHIQTVFYRFDGYHETVNALAALKGETSVLRVDVELLEYQRQPR